MKRGTLVLLGVLSACGGAAQEDESKPDASIADGSAGAPGDASPAILPECVDASVPPKGLECTGLYTDVANKVVAPGVAPYAPAVPLWADGATKQRWIMLPPGTKIDATDPNEWTFPVGTKVWKEFSRDGQRVETRLWQKVQSNLWVDATYRWSADASSATISYGGDITVGDGGAYHIPTPEECTQCHRGRTDRILGFEQVSLGLAGATGLTLQELVAQGLIAPAPTLTSLTIGDDGTKLAAAPVAWLHINCGTTCHNGNSNAIAYGAGMRMRLDPTELDGRKINGFDIIATTIGVAATSPSYGGELRVAPGDTSHSLLYGLIDNRSANGQNQMPPIASSLVDTTDVAAVAAWIRAMPAAAMDAGTDAPVDTGEDAGETDAASSDAPSADDDGSTDADVADAGDDGAIDAGAADATDGATADDDGGDDDLDAGAPDDDAGDGS